MSNYDNTNGGKQEPNFVAYTEKNIINRIITSWFRHTGFLPEQMKLEVSKMTLTENEDHFRIEGEAVNDFKDDEV